MSSSADVHASQMQDSPGFEELRRPKLRASNAALFDLSLLRPLRGDFERELTGRHNAEMGQLLPVMGPLFGIAVLLFSFWDFMIDVERAWLALGVRIVLVMAGAAAYFPSRLHWTSTQRSGVIFCTHASAIILAEFLLKNGFLYGLAGIVACTFTVPVTTLRGQTFVLMLAAPTGLFIALSAISLTPLGFANNLMLYVFGVALSFVVLVTIRFFRQRAFLFEKELLHVSRHDSLTGACNRRYLHELAEREIALARRHGRALAVAMLDIDHFKDVNDTYGHDVGDRVLRDLVNACNDNLRMIDHIGRIGGEEFVCILPETGKAEALLCAERLRGTIEALRVDTPQGPLRFTVSIGVALLTSRHADASALLKDADTALYRAKHKGRNQVALAASSAPAPG
jgi:diguanylate cyclase (GGDEF)-like protein